MKRDAGGADGFTIRPLSTREEYAACVELQESIWGRGFSERVPAALLMVADRLGGVVAGAFDADGRLAAFVFGMTGLEDRRPVHWSDMLAVRPADRNRGLGERLKRYQRDALLPLGVGRVYWTFDPLESKNAYLNFARLGIVAGEYRRDLYGETGSPLHGGIGTDRLTAVWEIDSERVRRRLDGTGPPPTATDIAGLSRLNQVRPGPDGPVGTEPDLSLDAPRLLLSVPAAIQELKVRAPELARGWRVQTRAAFEASFARGYRAVELVREGDWSSYLLERAS